MAKKTIRLMPYKQNELFHHDDNIHLNACVGTNGGPYDFYAYSRGYFDASKRLSQSLIRDSSLVDLVVYPLVYTFRHAIELGLKDLGRCLPSLWDEDVEPKRTHALIDNWQMIKPYLTRAPVFSPDTAPVLGVENVLHDILEVDSTGEAFRFPEGRKGNLFLQDMSIINIAVFAEAIPGVSNAFEFWHETGYEYSGWKADAEAEME